MGKQFDLTEKFFENRSLVRQHIESFNYFIEKEIKQIVEANNIVDSDIDSSFYLKFLSIRIDKPTISESMVEQSIYPQECRIRDLTYAGNMYVDIEYIKNKRKVEKKNVFLGKMPIMLRSSKCYLDEEGEQNIYKSNECVYDNGGYFIIRGVEKVIQIQEQLSKNRIIVETGKTGMFCSVTSASIKHKSKTNMFFKKDTFFVQSNIFNDDVPVVLLIKAFGVEKDKEILDLIGVENIDVFENSFSETFTKSIFTQDDAIMELSKYAKLLPDDDKYKETKRLLEDKILPNIELKNGLRPKAVCLCLMVRRLILAKKGVVKPDDKDYLGNKRFELAGQLLSILFEDTFKKFNFELKKAIDKILSKRVRTSEFDALTFFNLQTGMVSTTLNRAISSGNWMLKRFKMERSGVTHVVTRYSYITSLGMMTKINSHFEKTRKVSGPRSLHTSSWGMFCPADTPEGESCGLVKNLGLLTEITTESDASEVEKVLLEIGVEEFKNQRDLYNSQTYLVFVNGNLFGLTQQAAEICQVFREKRRNGQVDKFVSIFLNEEERTINISCDNGRMCRPLFVMENVRGFVSDTKFFEKTFKNKTFDQFLVEGYIEYLDVNEQNNCYIALKNEEIDETSVEYYTHMEIADYAILSLVAGLVPFPHHNQSPRNTYQCAMGKQAIGHVGTNVKNRCDNLQLQLMYTQRPISASKVLDFNKYNKIPAGCNAMVAVMSYSGYDIEDAIILNKESLDRGFARVEVYRTVKVEFNRSMMGKQEEIYEKEGVKQIVDVGSLVKEGEELLTKVNPSTGALKIVRHKGYDAYVERMFYTKGDDDLILKIVLRETRRPEIGDKFSSRHGQKGVVGLIVPQKDLPFNEQGLSPDIIMNPHGFPSRMTVGKILEQITGKAGVCTGEYGDATAFNDNLVGENNKTYTDEACDILIKHGFSYTGKDVFTSGITGKQFEAYIFYGPIFYQRLKHMVADKIHCRARGPRAVLTRQPTEGRAKDGGLRLGEMERDCLIGYGASSLLNERLMHCSDEFTAYVCATCGVICYKVKCNLCNVKPENVKMPYACKLLFQELMAMNILLKIELKK